MEPQEYNRREGESEFHGSNNGNVVGSRHEMRQIVEHIHRVEEQKQDKVHWGWVLTGVIFMFSQLSAAVWWGAKMTTNQKTISGQITLLTPIASSKHQTEMRNLQLQTLTTVVKELSVQMKEVKQQVDGLESSLQSMYTSNRNRNRRKK
jgi:hypothetical protein